MTELNRIYHMDCLEGMKMIPDGSVDMILCDMPFGTTKSKWDKRLPLELVWIEYKRIIKPNGAILLFAKSPFDKLLAASNMEMYRYDWVWEKSLATGHLNAKKMPLQAHENILVFYKKPPSYYPQMSEGHTPIHSAKRINSTDVYGHAEDTQERIGATDRYPRSVLKFTVVNNFSKDRIHANQKPTALLEYLIKTYTRENEVVLDNCMGSGSAAIACLNTTRNFIGFETEEKYVQVANERIAQWRKE